MFSRDGPTAIRGPGQVAMTGIARSMPERATIGGEEAQRRWGWLPSALPSPLLLVIAGAWTLAVVAETTDRARWVHHHELGEGVLPWGSVALFALTWQVHVAAMMLPSSLPLLALFRQTTSEQRRRRSARAALLAGYLAVWTVFGFVALVGDAVLNDLTNRLSVTDGPRLVAGGALLIAGAFQFTSLKDRCLQQCRHPAIFLMTNYRRGVRAAWQLGIRHGLYCIGCCWALMLVMFTVGIANLAWLAPFALLMYYEKTGQHSDRHTRPIGLALCVLGVVVLMNPSWMPTLFETTSAHSH